MINDQPAADDDNDMMIIDHCYNLISFLDNKIPEPSLPNKNLRPSNVVDHIPSMTTS